MNKRRLTFKRVFNAHTYRYSEPTITARFDSYGEGETNQIIVETEQTVWEDMNARCFVRNRENHFLVGEVVNRLYEYEQLGYSPEELKGIIDDRKKLEERLNSLYGASAFDGNVESLYPRLFVARGNGKTLMETEHVLRNFYGAKIATLDEVNKNKSKVRYVDYHKADVENTLAAYGRIHHMSGPYPWGWNIPEIQNVIFNDPATIIFWKDGTKTVVKAEGEDFDPEKGLAMAISKKALGNKGNYFDIFKKWAGKLAKEYADMRARKKQEEHEPKWLAEQRLHNALHDKKATKADLRAAMEEAITYLEKEN